MSTTSHDTPLKRTMRWTISIYVCILVLALMPYVQRPAEGVKWLATAWTATILSLLWLIDVYRTGERRGITLLPLILAGFIGIHLLATFLSSYTRLGIFGLREYASLFALALASGHAFSEPRQVWPALVAFCSAMTVASLYGFCQKFGLDPFPWAINDSPEYLGLPSTFGNPNYAAHALVLGIVSSLVLALRPATRWCGALC